MDTIIGGSIMPGGDRTGPAGAGPMTGRAAGYCAGFPYPGYMNSHVPRRGMGWGRGRGWGRGMGMGWGRGWGRGGFGSYPYPPVPYPSQPLPDELSPDQEKEYLQQELDMMEKEMKALKKRMSDLEKVKK